MNSQEQKIRKLEEKIEKIAEENSQLKKMAEKSREKNSRIKKNNLSRRTFLKKFGAGIAGLGALTLSPTAANLKITKNGVFDQEKELTSKYKKAMSEGKVFTESGRIYSSVQTAVDNANDWVKIGPGTFNEPVTVSSSGITIEGSGYGTLIETGSGTALNVDVSDVKVKNLSIKTTGSNRALLGGTNTNISHCIVRSSGADGFHLGSNNILESCKVNSSNDEAVRPGDNCLVSNNIFYSSGFGSIDVVNSVNTIVTNNYIEQPSSTGTDGILGRQGGGNHVFIGNRVHNMSRYGIRVNSCDNCIIANNRVSNSGSTPIQDEANGTLAESNVTGGSN